jgi:glycosyltransferase involved in cell wall biosynthesis
MRILQTPARLFATGGVESYVRNLSRELAGMGHEVHVVCANTPKDNEVDERISVKVLRTAGKIANTNITPTLPLALLKEDFDILHTHLPTPWSADWSALASRLKDRPLVLTYHNDIVGEGAANYVARLYNKTALKLLLKSTKRIIVTRGEYMSPLLEGCMEKVAVITLGIDVAAFRPQERPLQGDIFFLSVLDEYHRYKGLEHLLGALKILKESKADVRLVVGGSGRLVEYYRNMAESLGIGANVRFAGFIPAEQLQDYYNGCRLFVLPSTDPTREGFGIVPLEAMACGKPVVTTDIAGIAKDIVTSGAGLVVDRENKAALAEAMFCILENENLAKKMGTSGRKLVEEMYSWRRVAEDIEKVYRGLV